MIDRKAFHTLSYGLFIIASKMPDGHKVGCVANTFQQIGSQPVRVSVSLNKENATTKAVQESGRFTVSVLSEAADMTLIGAFGFRSSYDMDKFAEVDHVLDEQEIPCVQQMCVATFSVSVVQTVDVGSHLLFIGEVDAARMLDAPSEGDAACSAAVNVASSEAFSTPMTYSFYHRVLRGKTPPKAASYLEEKPEGSTEAADAAPVEISEVVEEAGKDAAASSSSDTPKYAWRCTLCGYIETGYDGDLPDDYTCPICGVGKEFFERIEI